MANASLVVRDGLLYYHAVNTGQSIEGVEALWRMGMMR